MGFGIGDFDVGTEGDSFVGTGEFVVAEYFSIGRFASDETVVLIGGFHCIDCIVVDGEFLRQKSCKGAEIHHNNSDGNESFRHYVS